MARRAARRAPEISRGEILDAALACFTARGYHETSVDDIAERAGLSKGAIYWHFAGKRELFLALIDHFSERALAELDAVADAPDWRAALRHIFARVREQLEAGMPFSSSCSSSSAGAAIGAPRACERAGGRLAMEKQIARGVAAAAAPGGRARWGS
jgi:AcrR family transcriptional regulator